MAEKTKEHDQEKQESEVRLEYHKAFCEYLKFLITLSTGSIVLLTTFLEKLFTQPEWKLLVGIALGGFAISVVTAVIAYTIAVFHLGKDMSDIGGALLGIGLFFTWMSFLGGIVSLTIFALVNLF